MGEYCKDLDMDSPDEKGTKLRVTTLNLCPHRLQKQHTLA